MAQSLIWHLVKNQKKKEKKHAHLHSVWESWGRVTALDIFVLKAAYRPLADFKSFCLDQKQVCAAIVSDVLC